jgi:hypothetical protein
MSLIELFDILIPFDILTPSIDLTLYVNPFLMCLLCCTCKSFRTLIHNKISIDTCRFYVKHFMNVADICHSGMSDQYMKTVFSGKRLVDGGFDMPIEYAKLFILNGYLDVINVIKDLEEVVCCGSIIKCENYSIIVQKVIEVYTRRGRNMYGLPRLINGCRIAAELANNTELSELLHKKFPPDPKRQSRPDLMPSCYGHFENSQIEMIFDKNGISERECHFCARIGLNSLVKSYNQYHGFIVEHAGIGRNEDLLEYIQCNCPESLPRYICGLILGDHLDKIIMMQNDPQYTFDLTKIEVNLYRLVERQVSSKMIFFCIYRLLENGIEISDE